MKLIILVLSITTTLSACGAGTGTSPTVPKHEIEKKADTKISDAGPAASDDGGNAAH
jgi:hypothetical protein